MAATVARKELLWYLAKSAFCGSLELGFLWVLLAGIPFQLPRKMSSYLIYVKNNSAKCCTFNAICRHKAATNCIIVQHKIVLFASTSLGRTLLLVSVLIVTCKLLLNATIRLIYFGLFRLPYS